MKLTLTLKKEGFLHGSNVKYSCIFKIFSAFTIAKVNLPATVA